MIKNIVKFSIPSIANLFISAFAVFLLTRMFSTDDYATITIFNATTATLWTALCIGIDSSYIRFYNEPPEKTEYFSAKLLGIVLLFSVVFGAISVTIFGKPISFRVFGIESRLLWATVIISVLGQIIIRFLGISYRMKFESGKYGLQQVLLSAVTKFSFIIGVLFTSEITKVISINGVCVLLLGIVYLVVQRKQFSVKGISLSLKGYGKVFKMAVFSSPINLCVNLNISLSQQIIKSQINNSAVGIYGSASYFSSILAALQGGFATFWSAYMYANYKTNQEKIKKVNNFFLLALIFLYSILVLFKDVVYLLIGTDYHESKEFFSLVLLTPVLIMAAETTSYGMAIENKVHITLFGYIIQSCINCVLCFALTSVMGLKGAALASAISGIVLYIYLTFQGQRFYKSIDNKFKCAINIVLLISIGFSQSFFSKNISPFIIVSILIIALILNKAETVYLVKYSIKTLKKLFNL